MPHNDVADLRLGDCRDLMREMDAESIDAIVTDPPYELTAGKRGGSGPSTLNEKSPAGRSRIGTGFMGHSWDATGVALDPETWAQALRVLKPGGHLVAFGGTRTVHRMACAIEDAGFAIRDRIRYECAASAKHDALWDSLTTEQQSALLSLLGDLDPMGGELAWQFGSGFPKSVAFGRKMRGELAQKWAAWGSALKPAYEPIIVARKPFKSTLHANVERFGVGGINIDACRVETGPGDVAQGRWPANVVHDGSASVVAHYPVAPGKIADAKIDPGARKTQNTYGAMRRGRGQEPSAHSENKGAVGFNMRPGSRRTDAGSAARFFYCAKASRSDRHAGLTSPPPFVAHQTTLRQVETAIRDKQRPGNSHPTVKPTELMRWLVRLVAPAGALVLDPFMGSGSTGRACALEGMRFIGCETSPHYLEIATARIAQAIEMARTQSSAGDAQARQELLFETVDMG